MTKPYLKPASQKPLHLFVLMLDFNLIEVIWRLFVVIRDIYLQPLDDLFFGNCIDLLLDSLRLPKVCAAFEQIFPLVVKTLYCHHRLEVSFFFWVELDRDPQYLVYLCNPLIAARASCYFKISKAILSQTNPYSLFCIFWVWVFEPDYF